MIQISKSTAVRGYGVNAECRCLSFTAPLLPCQHGIHLSVAGCSPAFCPLFVTRNTASFLKLKPCDRYDYFKVYCAVQLHPTTRQHQLIAASVKVCYNQLTANTFKLCPV